MGNKGRHNLSPSKLLPQPGFPALAHFLGGGGGGIATPSPRKGRPTPPAGTVFPGWGTRDALLGRSICTIYTPVGGYGRQGIPTGRLPPPSPKRRARPPCGHCPSRVGGFSAAFSRGNFIHQGGRHGGMGCPGSLSGMQCLWRCPPNGEVGEAEDSRGAIGPHWGPSSLRARRNNHKQMIAAKNGEAMRQPAENPLALLCTNFLLQKYTYGQGMQKQAKQCSDMHVTTTLRLQSL